MMRFNEKADLEVNSKEMHFSHVYKSCEWPETHSGFPGSLGSVTHPSGFGILLPLAFF